MEHFTIVQALCRIAMGNASPALQKQVERLRDALDTKGEAKQAAALTKLLRAAERTKDVAPTRLVRSRAQPSGEMLHSNTHLPVDRETSAHLAEILFPADILADAPQFNSTVAAATKTIIEEWTNFEALSEVDLRPPRTCLIYGAPGVGKTRLALWIARELDLPIVQARLDGLVSSFLGTTARNISNLFAFANRHRCLLLLDEFDAIAKLRDDPQEVGEIKRVVNALLQNLDGRMDLGFTIAITNHELLLDPAVWRRFEVQLEIPKPEFETRIAIARHFMQPIKASGNHFRLIAWFTEGCTGAEIESFVRTYKKAATLRDQGQQHLLDTLKQFATLNSARMDAGRRALLFGDAANLFRAMKDDPLLGFSLADIGAVAGRDKSTVSRKLGKTAVKPETGSKVSTDD